MKRFFTFKKTISILLLTLGALTPLTTLGQTAHSPTDLTLSAEIGRALLEEHFLPYKNVRVDTCDGVVRISGNVRTQLEHDEVENIACHVDPRIKKVDVSGLQVEKSHSHFKDFVTYRRIKNKIYMAQKLGRIDRSDAVIVDAKNGYIHLTGTVKSPKDIGEIINMIFQINGIVEIDNNIHIAWT